MTSSRLERSLAVPGSSRVTLTTRIAEMWRLNGIDLPDAEVWTDVCEKGFQYPMTNSLVQAYNPIARSGQTGLLLDGSKEPVADAASSGRVPNHHASDREAMAVSSPPAPVATRACCLRSVAERVSMRDWGHFNQANSRFTLKLKPCMRGGHLPDRRILRRNGIP
jgi:hypothetical protein